MVVRRDNMEYRDFIYDKADHSLMRGSIKMQPVHKLLFPFQADLVEWAVKTQRAAIFADCGLGKTLVQLEWARMVGDVLIVAPLAVSKQTVREGLKVDMDVNYCRRQEDVRPGITITNYEMVTHFDPASFAGIVLDESSILKSYSGKYRQELTEFASTIPARLCCTATPAPNDLIEIINHAEFLGIMTGKEVIANYFIQDGNTTHKWRLKGHAIKPFWTWLASWSVALQYPSDMGYGDDGFILPGLIIHEHIVDTDHTDDSRLFGVEALTLDERRAARKGSLNQRVEQAREIVNASPDESWVIWCDLNAESEAASKALGATEIRGSDKLEDKEARLWGFSTGEIKRIVTKPSIAGFGMNWQHCHNVLFLGLSDSYEQFYQAVRRCWRFGQTEEVNAHIIISENERAVLANIKRKEAQARGMYQNIIGHMRGVQMKEHRPEFIEGIVTEAGGEGYHLYRGDSVEVIKRIKDDSVGLSVFSPPFPGMYVYTDSEQDMGNCSSLEEMVEHFSYLIPDLLRITMPGRTCALHLTQAVAFKWLDGYMGIKDFRGAIIRAMESAGWVFYGEVTIDKDPQVKAIRTKDRGLLFKSLAKDSANMHMALADYLLQFKKPGDNPEPIRAGISEKYDNADGWITPEEWIEWAAPVWYRQTKNYPGGIRETDVLNVACARDTEDEKHLCPLQLGVIERAVKLWSNPGDIIFSPFMGIGSEGYQSILLGRQFIGIELKQSYFEQAKKYIEMAVAESQTGKLFA